MDQSALPQKIKATEVLAGWILTDGRGLHGLGTHTTSGLCDYSARVHVGSFLFSLGTELKAHVGRVEGKWEKQN